MTESVVAYCDLSDSNETGTSLGMQIKNNFKDETPDVVIVFASSKYNYGELLTALKASCNPKYIVGCSSAGEFIGGKDGESAVSALALRSNNMHFSLGVGKGLSLDREVAAKKLASSFEWKQNPSYRFRSVLILADALAGYTDELMESLTAITGGAHQFFGGGAGDDAKFSKTHVFLNTEALTDAVVGLEILSHSPIGVGVQHGWVPTGEVMRVTEAEGMKLVSLNGVPAGEIIAGYAKSTGQKFDGENPIPFFLHNVLAIQTKGGFKLRVPLAVSPDGSVMCASNIPTGATVSFMKASSTSSIEAAQAAAESAMDQIKGHKPKAALFFDCVATRLRMGKDFSTELKSVKDALGPDTMYAGCNTYGQIARVDKQFSGFHNCTAVVCVFPE